ncbi:HEAT repeat domain-containing protein [Oceanirhabdus sp. W0125-5]|uniref:HEAT repeat domain-containing protein n=1 Tax=Oceanirhabdus sp. W0125-5 TaxID=2999116 RepID=UPI0022F305AC|nr:HEAT repeat domain-containing protein [Oceanirhabdus sp. W0125-5]WBW99478.1 HEAT repeat domain-containing protein [Oceanirhabdus sp. W0125-5]
MDKNLWENFEKLSDEEITFQLYSEGKSIDLISRIRNMEKSLVQKQLIEFKMKNRYIARIKSSEDIFKIFANANKKDKLNVLSSLDDINKSELIEYIKGNYTSLNYTDKTTAAWIIGELSAVECRDVLLKASVHKAISVRRMAISAMGKLEDISMKSALIRALNDENDQVVLYAINALKKLKCSEAKEKVVLLKGKRKDYIDRAIDGFIEEVGVE